MIVLLSLAALLGLQKAPPPAAQAGQNDVRFHRVHLRNGNFLDGELVRQTTSQVILRVKFGDMSINRALIERVEFITMRGVKDKPEEVEAPKPTPVALAPAPPDTRPDPSAKPTSSAPPAAKAKGAAAAPFVPPAELKAQVDVLVGKLAKAAASEQDGVLRELAALGNDTAPYLAAVMETADPKLAELVGTVLIQQTNAGAAAYILRLFSHAEPRIRAQAALGLGSNGGVAYAAELAGLGKDKESSVRISAVTALSAFDDEVIWDPMTSFILDPERDVRSRALATLARLAGVLQAKERWVAALVEALEKVGKEGRADVLGALGRTKDAESALKAAPHLKDEDPEVRAAAAIALGELNNPETADELAARMADEDSPRAREAEARAAGTLKAKGAVETLVEWLGDENERVRQEAEKALTLITRQELGKDREKWRAWLEANK